MVERELPKDFLFSLGFRGIARSPPAFHGRVESGKSRQCLATPGCGPFGEDTIYDLGDQNFVFGTRPYSVTSGRELDKDTGIGSLDFQNNAWEATAANSNYNALQIQLREERGSSSRTRRHTPGRNPSTTPPDSLMRSTHSIPNLSRALSTFDVTHNFVVSYGYELPFVKVGSWCEGQAAWWMDNFGHHALHYRLPDHSYRK